MKEINRERINFEVKKEIWNEYKLDDGTIMKIKCVLVKIFKIKGKEEVYNINSNDVIGIIAPDNLLGEPSEIKYSQKELVESIVEDDIDFKTIKEDWNEYMLSDGKLLKLKSVPTKIAKTNKFDSLGEPIYLVQTQPMAKSIHPNRVKS